MNSFKQLSVIALALASGIASAASQPFVAANATVSVDTSYLTTNGYTVSALGSATYDAAAGTLSDPVQAVSNAANPGPLTVDFADTAGFKLTKGFTSVKLTDFTFDLATNTLYGDVGVGILLNLNDQALLTASTVSSSFGNEVGTSVSNSASPRSLGLLASGFTLAPSFVTFLSENGVDPATLSFVGDVVKQIKVGTVVTPSVPEPSTYAMMGVGLVAVGLLARRRRAA